MGEGEDDYKKALYKVTFSYVSDIRIKWAWKFLYLQDFTKKPTLVSFL